MALVSWLRRKVCAGRLAGYVDGRPVYVPEEGSGYYLVSDPESADQLFKEIGTTVKWEPVNGSSERVFLCAFLPVPQPSRWVGKVELTPRMAPVEARE